MTHEQYQLYLQTPHWRETREKRLQIDKNKCAFCGSLGPLHVHHRSYKRLWQEDVEQDLITLCVDCHHKLHQLLDEEKPYVDGLYDEWKEEANTALKVIAEKYLDKQIEHCVKSATPFVIHNGYKSKPTIVRIVVDSMDYSAGKRLNKDYPWYNAFSRSIYSEAIKRLPKRKR